MSGKYHACLLPGLSQPNPKIEALPLFRERMMLACAADHPLAALDIVPTEEIATHPYVDRISCEFHGQITAHFMDRDAVMRPRFRAEREDWVQQMVARGHAICIMPESSAVVPGIVTRPVTGLDLTRELVFATVFGSGAPVEIRQIARLAKTHDWRF